MRFLRLLLVSILLPGLAGCESMTREDWVKVAAVTAVVGAAYYASRHGSGGGMPLGDTDWDWDEFYWQGQLIWACRGVSTGQFANHERCSYKAKSDWRWPDKQAPRGI